MTMRLADVQNAANNCADWCWRIGGVLENGLAITGCSAKRKLRRMRVLISTTLRQPIKLHKPVPGLIHHTDRSGPHAAANWLAP